jgi:tetratricopeptide (TPR) repeat protein
LQELESVDFYISQGYSDLALETLHQLEMQFGSHSEIENRREQLKPAPQTVPAIEFNSSVKAFEQKDKSFENGFNYVVETKAELSLANGNSLSVNPNFEDLFQELGDDVDITGLESSQSADFETHYNLGLAYKEMGLFDDAVEEFQAAAKMTAPGDGSTRYLQCCNLIGHCFLEKGMPELAVKWYQKGLETPGISDEEYQALRFELGTAYEKAGEKEKAIAQFTEVYALNVAYRGVGDKLRSLQTVG